MAATKPAVSDGPTLPYLSALRSEQEQDFRADDLQIDRMRAVRSLTQPVALPPEARLTDVEVRDSTIADEVQRVVATLSLNRPKLQCTPARPGDSAQENATLREHWTEALLQVAGSRQPGQDTFRACVDAAVGDGGAWTKLLFLNDVWTERYSAELPERATLSAIRAYNQQTEEAKKAAGPPFAWLNVDVRQVYPVWSGLKLAEVLEVAELGMHRAFRQYRVGYNKRGELVPEELSVPMNKVDARHSARKIVRLEHWDRTWCSVVLLAVGDSGTDGRIVRQWQHGYGQPPYFYAPGLTYGWQQHRKVGYGVSESKRWLVEYRSYLLTLQAQIAARDGMSPLVREMPVGTEGLYGDDRKQRQPERYGLRDILDLPPGATMRPLFANEGAALKDEIALVTQMIEKSESPRISSEIGTGLEGAGFAISQVLAEAKVREDPICQHIEQMLREVTLFLWRLVRDRVRETVYVRSTGDKSGWLGAGPDDLDETVDVQWQMDPERASAKLIEERYWHERVEKGTASLDQAIEEMGDNPDEVRLGRALDRIRQSPTYQQLQDKLVFQAAGRGDLVAQAAEAERVAQQGILPGAAGGTPGLTMAPAPVAAMGGGGAPGVGAVPDMGNLAAAPGGAGPAGPQPATLGNLGAVPPDNAAAAGARI